MKYFLFDIGHVLVDFDFQVFLDTVFPASEQHQNPLSDRDLEMHNAVETGHISDADWVDYLNETKELSWTTDDLISLWSEMFSIHKTGHRLFKEVMASGVKVYTLSNIAKHHMDAIEKNWSGFFEGAEGLFLSYQMGVRKPAPSIYQQALETLEAEGRQCFFIDDRPENIEAAQAAGIQAYQFIPENYELIREAASAFFEMT